MSKNIKHLVVDTTAFIKAANLLEIAANVYTVQEVVDEITNDRQRKKLVVLPYDLKIKDVFTENIKFITEFSKKTGDYLSLSATDLKVMALCYQLEKENVGTDHLKQEPTMQKTIKVTGLAGYGDSKVSDNTPNSDKNDASDDTLALQKSVSDGNIPDNPEDQTQTSTVLKCSSTEEIQNNEISNSNDQELDVDVIEQIKNMDLKDDKVDELIVKVSDDEEDEEESESEEDSDSDGGDWITPGNLAQKKREMDQGELEEKVVEVACITSDFAMQNVLKQIGLNVTSIDGRIIRQLRTFIFRCTTCFKTTSVMTKLFCPKCGHSTLKKVAVSVDDEGNQHIHINGRKPLTARGKKFSLPTPRGGQHFQYPILTEDQHIHKRFATKLGRSKTNALDPDYIAGFSPFAMKDVNSKSAVLGVRAKSQDIKYWMKHYSKGKKN